MIFGIDVRQRITRSVELVCPRCGLDRTGVEVVPGRWASVFGLPIIPLGEHEPEIVCDDCGHTSDLGVLDVPTSSQLSALLLDATIAALVLAIRSTNSTNTARARSAATLALAETGFEDAGPRLDDELSDLSNPEARLRLRRLGSDLTAFGKQGFLHRVAAVVSSSDPISIEQRDTLARIGCDLGMAAPHINGILAVATIAA